MSLFTIQEEFKRYIQTQDSAVANYLANKDANMLDERLAVYSDGYWLRLYDALHANYPAIYLYLGDELFEELTTRYIKTFPPTDTVIRFYGDHLSDFLQIEYPERPCLVEMATIEWEMGMALDSQDAPPLALTDLAHLAPEDWESLTFKLHPSARLISLRTNAFDLINAVHARQMPRPIELTHETSQTLLIWRHRIKPCLQILTTEQRWLLDAIVAGTSFGEICAGLCEWFAEEEAAPYAANTLFGWINQELFLR